MQIVFDQRPDGLFDHALAMPTHLGDLVGEEAHILFKRRNGMLRHHRCPKSRMSVVGGAGP